MLRHMWRWIGHRPPYKNERCFIKWKLIFFMLEVISSPTSVHWVIWLVIFKQNVQQTKFCLKWSIIVNDDTVALARYQECCVYVIANMKHGILDAYLFYGGIRMISHDLNVSLCLSFECGWCFNLEDVRSTFDDNCVLLYVVCRQMATIPGSILGINYNISVSF